MTDKERDLPNKNQETPMHFGPLTVDSLIIDGDDPMVKLKLQYPHAASNRRLGPPDLVPGDPGWTPNPQPDCYETPEKFTAAWEALKAQEPHIETRMRRPQVSWNFKKKRF